MTKLATANDLFSALVYEDTPPDFIRYRWRLLREAGHVPTGTAGRGVSARINTRHAALLMIALALTLQRDDGMEWIEKRDNDIRALRRLVMDEEPHGESFTLIERRGAHLIISHTLHAPYIERVRQLFGERFRLFRVGPRE